MNEDDLAAFLGGETPDDGGNGPSRRAARHVRDLLADDTLWAEPASDGADALLETIQSELADDRDEAPYRQRRRGRRTRPGRAVRRAPPSRRRLLALAAAIVVLVAGTAAVLVVRGGETDGREFAIASTDLAPGASAVATVENQGSGVAIQLDVSDLPPAEPGTYYQGWVKGTAGLVTVGTFHMRGGDDTVDLWAGVELDRYPTLTVTIQQEGAGQESSGDVVLTGEIVP